ncbi:MAG: ATP-dependent helicase [Firmicutes bacterium]|nr:ATP-dependent helicase [Bacillota bacterium]
MDIGGEFMRLRDRVIESVFPCLNEEQLGAVISGEEKVLVAACPGAGKTQVIINRIVYLNTFGTTYGSGRLPKNLTEEDIRTVRGFLEGGDFTVERVPEVLTREAVHSSNIVVITFTRMAARGMEERYRKVSGKVEAPFFGTFHSLFYRIMEKRLGGISMISENEASGVIGAVLAGYTDAAHDDKVRGVLNDISQYKNRRLLGIPYEPSTDMGVFRECFAAYEEYKAGRGFLDFDDLLIECSKLFEEEGEVLSHYRNLFRNILVDEFQDCDSQQIHMLKLLGEGGRIFAVGDEDQCIYGFRGSRPDCMVDFESHFEGGVKHFLNRNYRSRCSIIDAAKNLIGFNLCRNEKKMRAVRMEQGEINLVPCRTERDQAEKAAEIILALKDEGRLNDTAVLYRTNRECALLTASLLKSKAAFNVPDKTYNFLEESPCRDMLAYFRLSLDASDRESFVRIANRPNRYIGSTLIDRIRSCAVARNSFSLLAEQRGISLELARSMLRLESQVRRLKPRSPVDAVDYVLRKIGYRDYLEKSGECSKALEEFSVLAAGFGSIRELLEFADEYDKEMKNAACSREGVVLSTIHGVKGLEYSNVIIINCREDNMPHPNSQSDTEEERRIFYVGVTRAADKLWLLWPEEHRGKSCRRSPFISELCGG